MDDMVKQRAYYYWTLPFDSFSVHSFSIFLCLRTANRMFWMPQQTNKRSYCYYMNVEIIYWKDDLALVKMSKGYHIEKVSNVILIVQETHGWLCPGASFRCEIWMSFELFSFFHCYANVVWNILKRILVYLLESKDILL